MRTRLYEDINVFFAICINFSNWLLKIGICTFHVDNDGFILQLPEFIFYSKHY